MIFLSHTKTDKDIVEPIAIKLADTFVTENVFYDSWSIQPGNGIIDKMNEGLSKCTFFFFFVSKNSLNSKMCSLEWQNTLMKASSNKNIKFIPVRIDNIEMPYILTQTLYIDMHNNTFEVGIRQIFDVIMHNNTFRPENHTFSNLKAYITKISEIESQIEIRAEHFMEPISNFLFAFKNDLNNIKYECINIFFHSNGKYPNLKFENGESYNCIVINLEKATAPGFPLKIKFSTINKEPINLISILHEKQEGNFVPMPLILN